MAIGFGATLGTGTTDRVDTGINTVSANRTWVIRFNRNGTGGNSAGKLFDLQSTGNAVIETIGWVNSANALRLTYDFSVTDGVWTFTGGTLNAANTWNTLAVRYNHSSTANNPVAYCNGAALTVTRTTGPFGASTSATPASMHVGNRSQADRAWDGQIAGFAVFDRLLSDEEMIAVTTSPNIPLCLNRVGLIYYNPMTRANQDRIGGRTQTATGTAVQPHPRSIYP